MTRFAGPTKQGSAFRSKVVGLAILVTVAWGVLGQPMTTRADEMDPTLSRLALAARDCPEGFAGTLCADNALYKQLVSQLGISMAAPVTTPAHTTGYAGFYLGLGTTITGIDAKREYWRRGTQGGARGAEQGANPDVNDALVWTRAEVRKGLPFGFELGGAVGHALDTGLWSLGGSLKIAPLEGFRDGPLGMVPDFAIRFSVETLVGSPHINLTVPSLDWIFSKPFTVGGVATITPLLGLQTAWLIADSELVDLTPGDSAFARCMPLPGHASSQYAEAAGTPRCAPGGSPEGYADNAAFDALEATRWRGFLGVQGRYRTWLLNAMLHVDLLEPQDADGDVPGRLPRQLTLHLGAGVEL